MLKQEISQQVRELRAQNRSQRACSPAPIQNNSEYPQGACDRKERPRDTLLSPSQAAIQIVVSAEPRVKGQVQKPQSGLNPTSIPAIKLVSARPRCRSHSPRCRIDVDVVQPECQGGWRKGEKAVSCPEWVEVPSDWEAMSPDPYDLLSKSFPPLIQNRLCTPACNSAGFLQVPGNLQRSFSSHCLLSTSPANAASCWDAVLR